MDRPRRARAIPVHYAEVTSLDGPEDEHKPKKDARKQKSAEKVVKAAGTKQKNSEPEVGHMRNVERKRSSLQERREEAELRIALERSREQSLDDVQAAASKGQAVTSPIRNIVNTPAEEESEICQEASDDKTDQGTPMTPQGSKRRKISLVKELPMTPNENATTIRHLNRNNNDSAKESPVSQRSAAASPQTPGSSYLNSLPLRLGQSKRAKLKPLLKCIPR